MSLVVDASVAFKWFLVDEPLADRALAIVQEGTPLIAPDLLIAEVCNAAWRAARLGRLSPAQAGEIAAVLPDFFDSLVSATALASRAVTIAGRIDHPVYDCLYLALAELRDAALVTADLQLMGKLTGTPWVGSAMALADYAGDAPSPPPRRR